MNCQQESVSSTKTILDDLQDVWENLRGTVVEQHPFPAREIAEGFFTVKAQGIPLPDDHRGVSIATVSRVTRNSQGARVWNILTKKPYKKSCLQP